MKCQRCKLPAEDNFYYAIESKTQGVRRYILCRRCERVLLIHALNFYVITEDMLQGFIKNNGILS